MVRSASWNRKRPNLGWLAGFKYICYVIVSIGCPARALFWFVSGNWLNWYVLQFMAWIRLAMEAKGQAPARLSPPGPSAVGRAAQHGKQLNMLLLGMQQPDSRRSDKFFTLVGCCWSHFRTIICQPEQSIQPWQPRRPLLECLCMSRGASVHTHTHTHAHAHKIYSSSCAESPTHT